MKKKSFLSFAVILLLALLASHCNPHQVPQGEKKHYQSPPPEADGK